MLLCPSEKTTHLPHVTLSNISLPEEPPYFDSGFVVGMPGGGVYEQRGVSKLQNINIRVSKT